MCQGQVLAPPCNTHCTQERQHLEDTHDACAKWSPSLGSSAKAALHFPCEHRPRPSSRLCRSQRQKDKKHTRNHHGNSWHSAFYGRTTL